MRRKIYRLGCGSDENHFWVSKDYPHAQAIQEQMDRLQHGGLADAAASMMPPPSELPGVRLKTELEMPGRKVTSTTVHLEVQVEAVDPPPACSRFRSRAIRSAAMALPDSDPIRFRADGSGDVAERL